MNDTSPEAEKVLIDVYQRMPGRNKAAIVGQLSAMTRTLCEAGFRRDHPMATDEQFVDFWMRQTLSPELYLQVRNYSDELARQRLEGTTESGAGSAVDVDSVRGRRIAG